MYVFTRRQSRISTFSLEREIPTPQLTQDGGDTSLKLFLFYCYFWAFQYIFFWKSTFFTAACGSVGVDVLSIQRCSTSSSSRRHAFHPQYIFHVNFNLTNFMTCDN